MRSPIDKKSYGQPLPDRTTELELALSEAQILAQRGFEVASHLILEAEQAVDAASQILSETHSGGGVDDSEFEELWEQREQFFADVKVIVSTARTSLESRRESLAEFSIALFGRTMTGKSTLMEILTNGDGSSIGKGAQRTTRDVRSYFWNGLKVIDMPGVAAFEGEEDEPLAFEAAANSDLALCLVTDDGPKDAEARWVADLQALGKPLVGVCNVKYGIANRQGVRLIQQQSKKIFDKERLACLSKQFQESINRYVSGLDIEWVFVHLNSRYLADKPSYEEISDELCKFSHWNSLEQRIIDAVIDKGGILRFKSVLDGAVAPSLKLIDQLLEGSDQNKTAGDAAARRHKEADIWVQSLNFRAHQNANAFLNREIGELRNLVPRFVESNLEDKDFFSEWENLLERRNLTGKADARLKQLRTETEDYFGELFESLRQEINIMREFAGDRTIKTGRIHDLRWVWILGKTVSSGVVFLGRWIPGPSWVAAVVALGARRGFSGIQRLFGRRRDRELAERRQKLTSELNKLLGSVQEELHAELHGNLDSLVWESRKNVKKIEARAYLVSQTGTEQRNLGWKCNRIVKLAHLQLLYLALERLGVFRMAGAVHTVARVPGEAMAVSLKPGRGLTDEVRADVTKLLGERVLSFRHSRDPRVVISKCIGRGCRLNDISIDEKEGTARVYLRNESAEVVTGVKLAQQLTGLRITR